MKFIVQAPMLSWGGVWDPFFFILNGFKLTYVQLCREDPDKFEPLWRFMKRRLRRVVPVYWLSVLVLVVDKLWADAMGYRRPESVWWKLPYVLSLAQCWFLPFRDWRSWNGPAWFLSTLAGMWLLWYLTVRRVGKWSATQCWIVLALCYIGVWLRILIAKSWHVSHPYNAAAVFSPVANFNLYMCGMCLARLFVLKADVPFFPKNWLTISTCGKQQLSLSGLVSLGMLFCYFAMVPPFDRQPAKIGMLMPAQAALIWNLVSDKDALARAFRWQRFGLLSKYSFAFSMNQFFVIHLFIKIWIWKWTDFSHAGLVLVLIPANFVCAVVSDHVAETMATLAWK